MVVDDDNGQGTYSYTADVTNVPPRFLGQPSVSFEMAPEGTLLSVTLEGDLFEQNPNDVLELEKLKKGEQIKVSSGFGNNVSNTETADKTKYPKANRFILVTDFPTLAYRYPDMMTRMSVKQTVIIKCDGKDLDRFTHTFDLGWEITKPGARPGAKKFLKFT